MGAEGGQGMNIRTERDKDGGLKEPRGLRMSTTRAGERRSQDKKKESKKEGKNKGRVVRD